MQERDAVVDPPDAHGYFHTSAVPSSPVAAPAAADLAQAAEVLNAGRARSRCWSAPAPSAHSDLVEQVADRLGAGAAKALLGKTVLDDRAALGDRGDRAARHHGQLAPDARTATPC